MKITQTSNITEQTSFKSHFVRSRIIRSTLTYDKPRDIQTARQYVRAIESLLRDGRNDKLDFVQRKGYVAFKVNDKEYSKFETNRSNSKYVAEDVVKTIIDFAEKERGVKKVKDFENLSAEEINYARELDVENQFKDLDKQDPKYFTKLAILKDKVAQAIRYGIEHKLYQLDKEIGKPNKTQSMLTFEEIIKKILE